MFLVVLLLVNLFGVPITFEMQAWRGSLRSYLFVRLWRQKETKRKRNGYPFTTFTDLSDFLGIYAESLVGFTGKCTDIPGKSSSSLVVPVVVVKLIVIISIMV